MKGIEAEIPKSARKMGYKGVLTEGDIKTVKSKMGSDKNVASTARKMGYKGVLTNKDVKKVRKKISK